MTSLNAGVISIRLLISLVIQRLMAELVGEAGISKVGQLRNLSELITSFSSVGIFNGIVKYVSEHKEDKVQLQKLFSTAFVFTVLGTFGTGLVLFLAADFLSERLFASQDFSYLLKLLAVTVPFVAMYRVFNGIINGLSKYKKFAKIDLFSYLLSSVLTVVFLFQFNIDGVLIAIALTPIIQFFVLLFIFIKELKEYLIFSKISFKTPFAKGLLSFSLMSFFSTVLLNYVEIDIRTMVVKRISEADAGIWTAMSFISKNYMVFSSAIFSLYVLPKFAGIYTKHDFKKELFSIYKTLLPLFGVGMVLIYLFRDLVIQIIYPDFTEMSPLFKWQLMGDFIRLAALVLMSQFLAKKLVRSFIFSEIISLGLFYFLARYLVDIFGIEGIVMAHFARYIVYFFVVFYLVFRYFNKKKPID